MRLALGLALLASTALALPPRPGPPVPSTTVAIGVDGGPVTVTCTNCSGGGGSGGSSSLVWVDGGRLSADVLSVPAIYIADGGINIENWPTSQAVTIASMPSTPVTNSGLTNLDVALSTRTKPADQQHTIIDSSAAIAVTGPATDAQLRATPLPISGAVTASVTGATLAAGSALIGHVISDTGSTTAVTGNVAVTGTFWQATQPVSIASLPASASQGIDPTGTAQTMATTSQGVQLIQQVNNPLPLNPFLPRCNPVRRTGCQP